MEALVSLARSCSNERWLVDEGKRQVEPILWPMLKHRKKTGNGVKGVENDSKPRR